MRLTHLAPEKYSDKIRKNGISVASRNGWQRPGVYAMPILPAFFASHQWLRELRRRGQRSFVAIDFVISGNEIVLVGHYSRPHLEMPVVKAAGLIRDAESALGYEIVVQRRVERSEIARVRSVPQVVGWRYFPDSHGRAPCGCPACAGGGFGDRRLKDRYELENS